MAAGMCRICSRMDLSAWEILAQGSWEQLSCIRGWWNCPFTQVVLVPPGSP